MANRNIFTLLHWNDYFNTNYYTRAFFLLEFPVTISRRNRDRFLRLWISLLLHSMQETTSVVSSQSLKMFLLRNPTIILKILQLFSTELDELSKTRWALFFCCCCWMEWLNLQTFLVDFVLESFTIAFQFHNYRKWNHKWILHR